MIHLKQILIDLKIKQSDFCLTVGVGKSAFNVLLNTGVWPKNAPVNGLKENILFYLGRQGVSQEQMDTAFNYVAADCDNNQPPTLHQQNKDREYFDMLLRKQVLNPEVKKQRRLFKDPFSSNDVTEQDDVFSTPSIRYVREALYQTARSGGFISLIAESGSGKTTLRKDLITRLDSENQSVIIVEPFVLGMEDNDKSGKTLKSAQIAESIITAVDPLTKPRMSSEARFRQMHQLLLESAKAGNKHCLIIEEAHGLSIPTLKHLKRFYELEHGFNKLLSIILIAQPEMHNKLSESNPAVRAVVQRCEVVTLDPLGSYLKDYLYFKFKRTGADCAEFFDDSAFEAMENKLTMTGKNRARNSLLYPLAVNNLAAACINLAVSLGEEKVTADVVNEVN